MPYGNDPEQFELGKTLEELQQLSKLIENESKLGLGTFMFMHMTGIFGSLAPLVLLLSIGPSSKQVYVFNEKASAIKEYLETPANTHAINTLLYSHLESITDGLMDYLKRRAKEFITDQHLDNSSLQQQLSSFTQALNQENVLLNAYYLARSQRRPEDIAALVKDKASFKQFEVEDDPQLLLRLAEAFISHVHNKHNSIIEEPQTYQQLKLHFDLLEMVERNECFTFRAIRFLSNLPERLPLLDQVNVADALRNRFFGQGAAMLGGPADFWSGPAPK
jgi:hypothetical protein